MKVNMQESVPQSLRSFHLRHWDHHRFRLLIQQELQKRDRTVANRLLNIVENPQLQATRERIDLVES